MSLLLIKLIDYGSQWEYKRWDYIIIIIVLVIVFEIVNFKF